MPLTLAEEIAIEDFAVCDLQATIKEKPEQVELLQDVMRKLMKKVFAEENSDDVFEEEKK